jgi:hypothetical protein
LAAQNVTGKPPAIDGKLAPGEWPEGTLLPGIPDVSFRLAYDADRLYLCWTGKGVGPIANDGQDFRRVFKTGACLDFQIAADDKADPGRAAPAKGDQRLLVTFIEKQPCVVLYQPVAPGAAPGEAWSANSQAGGLTKIDRIVQLRDGVAVAASNAQDFAVEVAVPLKAPGLRPTAGLRLRGDWGILTSADGHQVKARAYWSNAGATGTADEAVEARLEPQFWGVVEFR